MLNCFSWLQMGDPLVEVTEENRDASQAAKAKAIEAISEGSDCVSNCLYISGLGEYKIRGMQYLTL